MRSELRTTVENAIACKKADIIMENMGFLKRLPKEDALKFEIEYEH